jgi:FtsH-binding integral membrane protein
MAGWGVVGTLILNMLFFHNEGFRVVISVIGVLVFAAFTAYDTQKLKAVYYQLDGNQSRMAVATNVGALRFYIDFINMFQLLLSLFGGRR